MADFIAGVLIFFMVLMIWALLGHGLWLLAAAILRALSGKPNQQPSGPDPLTRITLEDELRASLRQLHRLWRRGHLTDSEYARLSAVCRRDLERLSGDAPLPTSSPEITFVEPAPSATPAHPERPATISAAGSAQLIPSKNELEPDIVQAEVIEADVVSEPVAQPVHPLDRVDEPVAPRSAGAPRAKRALADVLAAFMQERNIRWGELVSGLLIVGSAAGLVLSLRAQLKEWIPYFPALLFLLGTSAIHGAGLYTLKRWNLRSTSRGVLLISLLLVPINFLAAVLIAGGESQRPPVTSVAYIVAVAIGLSAFALITYTGARALVDRGWSAILLAVMGASASQLYIHRRTPTGATQLETLRLALPPTLAFISAIGMLLVGGRHWRRLTLRRAQPLWMTIGLGSFALIMPLALLIGKADSPWGAIGHLAPIFALIAAALLSAGIFISQRTLARRLAMLSTAGVSLAIFGGLLMLVAVGLAWPSPSQLVLVGALCFAILTLQANLGRIPLLLGPAVASGTLALVIGFHWWQKNLVGESSFVLSQRIHNAFLMGRTGLLLTVEAVTCIALALVGLRVSGGKSYNTLSKPQSWLHSQPLVLLASGLAIALLGVCVATKSGFTQGADAELATLVFAINAVAVCVVAVLARQPVVTYAAAGLSLLTVIHALGFNPVIMPYLRERGWLPLRPVLLGVLLHANFLTFLAFIAKRVFAPRDGEPEFDRRDAIEKPLAWSAVITAALATCFAVYVFGQQFGHHAGYTLLVATAWLGAALVLWRSEILTAAQVMFSLALTYGVLALCQRQRWWGEVSLDPRVVYPVVAALAALSIGWLLLRMSLRRLPDWEGLFSPPWPGWDELVLLLSISVVAVSAIGAWLGGHEELSQLAAGSYSEQWRQFQGLAAHPWAWVTMASIAIGLLVGYFRRAALEWVIALMLLALMPCLLLAAAQQPQLASASSLRWALAGYLLVMIAACCLRDPLYRLALSVPGISTLPLPGFSSAMTIGVSLVSSALPILLVTITACSLAALGTVPGGPIAETFFARLGWTVSYVVPLFAIVLSFVLLALRQQHSSFMMAGSLVWQLIAALACLMPVLTTGGEFDSVLAVRLLQFSALGLTSFALVWLVCEPWLKRHGNDGDATASLTSEPWLALQVIWMLAAIGGLALWAATLIIGVEPPRADALLGELGKPFSFVAIGLGIVSAIWFGGRRAQHHLMTIGLTLLTAVTPLIVASLTTRYASPPWFGYHLLLSGWLGVALVATLHTAWSSTLGSRAGESPSGRVWPGEVASTTALNASLSFATALSLVVFLCNLWTGWSDPVPPWMLLIGCNVLLVQIVLGISLRWEGFAYASLLIAFAAVSQAWYQFGRFGAGSFHRLITLNLLAGICVAGLWLVVAIYRERSTTSPAAKGWLPAVSLTMPPIFTAAYLFVIGYCLVSSLLWGPSARATPALSSPANLVLASALGMLLVGMFWYDRQSCSIPCMYLWGLATSILWCDPVAPDRDWLVVYWLLSIAAYIALSGLIWQAGAWWALMGHWLKVHRPVEALKRTSRWLPWITIAMCSIVALLDVVVVLNFETRLARALAGFGPMLLAIGLANLAQQERRQLMIYLSLLAVTFAAVLLSWADMPPSHSAYAWLLRSIRVLVVLGVGTLVFGAILPRVWRHLEDWRRALYKMALTCASGGTLALVAVLGSELVDFRAGLDSPLPLPQILVVAAVLLVFAAGLVALAVFPDLAERRGWNFTESSRMGYVYAAQVAVALVFAHLYLTRPTWFDGILRPYWPFVVLAIAFGGVGLGEMFARMKLRVLSEPLTRTAALLPLLPALGWWIESLNHEPSTDYALVMFVVGLLYVLHSFCRQSTLSAVAAGVAGNVALWALLANREGFAFLEHPQFWLIPPAISVLAAAQINQRRLSEEQLTAVRYLCMLVIYLSSTAEIFITGIGESTWPPLILMGISVGGVLAGIALQIRAFLYVGASFVFLSMVTMVWHASKAFQQVWPWWAFGICVGLAMLIMFGLFEKKRPEITALVERLRQWEH